MCPSLGKSGSAGTKVTLPSVRCVYSNFWTSSLIHFSKASNYFGRDEKLPLRPTQHLMDPLPLGLKRKRQDSPPPTLSVDEVPYGSKRMRQNSPEVNGTLLLA